MSFYLATEKQIEYLISEGVNVNIVKNDEGVTLLHIAAQNGIDE